MDISPSVPPLTSSPPGPVAQVPTPRPDELREACKQFEGIFIRQMLEQSLTPLLAQPEGGAGGGDSIHRYMIADVLSQSLSETGMFGIADMLQMQFQFPNPSQPSTPVPGKS